MMINFFGTLPGLLSLAGAAALLILISVLRRILARAKAARAAGKSAGGTGAAGIVSAVAASGPPRWLTAAVAAYAALGSESAPSAEAWKPAEDRNDPWLAAAGPGRRNLGVYK